MEWGGIRESRHCLMPRFSLERVGLAAPSLPLPSDSAGAEAELTRARQSRKTCSSSPASFPS